MVSKQALMNSTYSPFLQQLLHCAIILIFCFTTSSVALGPNWWEFLFSADIISCVEFNQDGELLATGDKGGRVVIFQVGASHLWAREKFPISVSAGRSVEEQSSKKRGIQRLLYLPGVHLYKVSNLTEHSFIEVFKYIQFHRATSQSLTTWRV